MGGARRRRRARRGVRGIGFPPWLCATMAWFEATMAELVEHPHERQMHWVRHERWFRRIP